MPKADFVPDRQEGYSWIITGVDTLYSNGIVEGKHVPVFGRNVSGLFVQHGANDTMLLHSFVQKGQLTGYYTLTKNGALFEDGFFNNGVRIILHRYE